MLRRQTAVAGACRLAPFGEEHCLSVARKGSAPERQSSQERSRSSVSPGAAAPGIPSARSSRVTSQPAVARDVLERQTPGARRSRPARPESVDRGPRLEGFCRRRGEPDLLSVRRPGEALFTPNQPSERTVFLPGPVHDGDRAAGRRRSIG